MIRVLTGLLIAGAGIFSVSCQEGGQPMINDQIVPGIKGWEPLFLNVTEDLNDIYFIGDKSGWIVGENQTLIATASGDAGWSRAPVSLPLENLRSVFFVDDQLGWIAGDLSGNPVMGQIGFTANGGGYPVQQETFDNPIMALYFIDRELGWAGGLNGLMIRTLDGGKNWTVISPFTEAPIYDLYFNETGAGWAATGLGGIFHTEDGNSWDPEQTDIDTDIFSIHMVDESEGWACGKRNTILKRETGEDGAVSWTRYTINSLPANQVWNDIFFIDTSTGWVVGELGQIFKTTDGGNSWKHEESNVNADLNAIYMTSPFKGWIAGTNGTILSFNSP